MSWRGFAGRNVPVRALIDFRVHIAHLKYPNGNIEMKSRTPFEDLAAAMAVRKDPLAQAMEAIDPVHLRALRQQQDELFGPTKLPPGVEEAFKTLAATDAALGVNRATAEAILGYKPGNAALDAALGLQPGGAVMDAAMGRIPNSLRDEIDRATAILKSDPLYGSPARDVLEQIGMHPDIKPANRGRRVAPPPAALPHADAAKDMIPIGSVADIGRRVREVRLGMGMTQQRFADMAGVGRRFLIELEQGKASLEIGRVLAVCQAAGIRLAFVA